jgi:hypothetical protein
MPWQTGALYASNSDVTFDVGLNTAETVWSWSTVKRKWGYISCNPGLPVADLGWRRMH